MAVGGCWGEDREAEGGLEFAEGRAQGTHMARREWLEAPTRQLKPPSSPPPVSLRAVVTHRLSGSRPRKAHRHVDLALPAGSSLPP